MIYQDPTWLAYEVARKNGHLINLIEQLLNTLHHDKLPRLREFLKLNEYNLYPDSIEPWERRKFLDAIEFNRLAGMLLNFCDAPELEFGAPNQGTVNLILTVLNSYALAAEARKIACEVGDYPFSTLCYFLSTPEVLRECYPGSGTPFSLSKDDKVDFAFAAQYLLKEYQPEPNEPETTPEPEPPATFAGLKLTTITRLRGTDASRLNDDQLFQEIRDAEGEIAALSTVKNKPKKLRAHIEEIKADIAALVAYIDSR